MTTRVAMTMSEQEYAAHVKENPRRHDAQVEFLNRHLSKRKVKLLRRALVNREEIIIDLRVTDRWNPKHPFQYCLEGWLNEVSETCQAGKSTYDVVLNCNRWR